jgi:hypothetical protein
MGLRQTVDDERLDALRAEHPGWDIWHVRIFKGPDAWCAKPIGQAVATINSDSPENVGQLINEHQAGR